MSYSPHIVGNATAAQVLLQPAICPPAHSALSVDGVEQNHTSTTVIRTASDLIDMLPEWKGLFVRSGCANIFLSPEWMQAWWECFGVAHKLFVVVVRSATGALIGLAPLYLSRNVLGARRLCLIGDRFVGSEHLDLIIDRQNAQTALTSIIAVILKHRVEWDYVEFAGISSGATYIAQCASELAAAGLLSSLEITGICPYATASGLRGAHRGSHRRNEKKCTRGLERSGTLTFETFRDGPGLRDAFECLVALHGARFQMRGDTSGFSAVEHFHRRALRLLAPSGCARIHILKLNGRPIAALSAFSIEHTLFFYQSGIDPEFARFSPGRLAISRSIDSAVAEGHVEIDFLRGNQSYKYEWAHDSRNALTSRIYGRTFFGFLICTAYRALATLRKVKRFIVRSGQHAVAPKPGEQQG